MNLVGTVDDIIIAGDLNYDMSLKQTPLHDFCDSLGFNNVIMKPTRLNPFTQSLTILDVILVLSFKFFTCSHVINFPMSDHSLCISVFNHSSIKYSPRAFTSRFLSKNRLNELRLLFIKYLFLKFRGNCQLVSLAKKRNMAYHRARNSCSTHHWNKYKKYRNLYKKCFRSSKQTFFKEATDSKTADPSKMWSTVKLKINPNSNTSITSISVAGPCRLTQRNSWLFCKKFWSC